ncbi:MAG: haloacid dehalogenase type II [Halioglobus sp.]|nr:haloacid dehalogenase type II [Halioglobus sp.]
MPSTVNRSSPQALLFDTYGTVCDFYQPLRRAFEALSVKKGVECDAGRMAIAWRTAYLVSTSTQALQETAFKPLPDINRNNLIELLGREFPATVSATEIEDLVATWEKLDPWPDVVEGLQQIKEHAIIGPLSNGNFADMVRLARHAKLPWDIILGASVSGQYKPHPQTYLKSVAALRLQPSQVCMVAAHQVDLAFASSHGMQTAFIPRPLEFGGRVKPKYPQEGVSYIEAAEVYAEGDWTFIAEDFLDLAAQLAT